MTPLSGSQIYKLDEVHPPPSGLQFFYLMTTGRGGIRFTTYKLDGTPHPVHPVTPSDSQISKNENRMASSGCPTRNFKVA